MEIRALKAVVTGAAKGIGRAITLRLLNGGASVAAFDIHGVGLDQLAGECKSAPGKLRTYKIDVSKEAEVERGVAAAVKDLGPLNCAVNNAGIMRDGLLVRSDPEGAVMLPLAQWNAVINTDLTGVFLVTREVVAHMLDTGTRPGVIINIASISRHGNPGQGNYAAAKAAVVAATATWGRELSPSGIRVGAIAPGLVRTEMLDAIDPAVLQSHLDLVPVRRLGTPDEIAMGVQFIVECDFFTARCLDIDGGFSF